MSSINHYKEKFWDHSNDELKDIVADRFGEASEEAVAAALELLKERNKTSKGELRLNEIPDASMAVLIDIMKNPDDWGEEAVATAEKELLRREAPPIQPQTDSNIKTFFQIALGSMGLVAAVILLKTIVLISFVYFFFHSVISCLNNT